MKTYIYSMIAIVLFAVSPIWLAYLFWFIDGMPDSMQEYAAITWLALITIPMGKILAVIATTLFLIHLIMEYYKQ